MENRFRRSDAIMAAPLDETVLLLNADTGRYHGLNPVAGRIWELLAESQTIDTLVDQLQREFDVAPDTCRQEVQALVDGLRERGLLIAG